MNIILLLLGLLFIGSLCHVVKNNKWGNKSKKEKISGYILLIFFSIVCFHFSNMVSVPHILVIPFFISLFIVPVGLIKPSWVIRWGERKTRKQVLKVYGGTIIIIFIVLLLTIPNQSNKTNNIVEENKTKEETVIKKVVKDEVGEENYRKHIYSEVTNHVTIWLTIEDNLTTEMIKKGCWKNSLNVFDKIYKEDNKVESIALLWYPKDSEYKAMSIEMERKTFNKYNLSTNQFQEIPNIASDYWEGPQFK